jgi:hypothetical protein
MPMGVIANFYFQIIYFFILVLNISTFVQSFEVQEQFNNKHLKSVLPACIKHWESALQEKNSVGKQGIFSY